MKKIGGSFFCVYTLPEVSFARSKQARIVWVFGTGFASWGFITSIYSKEHMMRKNILTTIATLTVCHGAYSQTCDTLSISLWEAWEIALEDNATLGMAREAVEIAQSEKGKIVATWLPTIGVSSEWIHTTTPATIERTLDQLTNGELQELEGMVADEPLLAAIVSELGRSEVVVPLAPRNIAAVSAEFLWPLFTGGKRMAASKMATMAVEVAKYNSSAARNSLLSATTEAYLAVELATRSVEVQREALASAQILVRNARSLEREGMINKAERLVAEVGESQRRGELAVATTSLNVARKTLGALLGLDTAIQILPTTPLFYCDTLPPRSTLLHDVLCNNPQMAAIETRQKIATEATNIARSSYFPEIAVVGGHRLWSSGIDKGMVPRTFAGVALSWTLFDGLARERSISQAHAMERTSHLAVESKRQELIVAVEQLYGQLLQAAAEYRTLCTTEELARELVRIRHKSFGEGMATASEVVESEVSLARTRLGSLAAIYRWDVALVQLLSLGGGLDSWSQEGPFSFNNR